jgi:serine/threonine-protein kinase
VGARISPTSERFGSLFSGLTRRSPRPLYCLAVVDTPHSPPRELVAGKYELLRLVAEGGMGSVYEARNTSTFKRCALKLLASPELEQHPEIVQRFFLEARAASVLESEHIVQVFDSGIDNETGRPYIIMEYLRGEDLKDALERRGPLEPAVAAKIALQAATGLAKAHEFGVFHRDIKPANLFLSRRDSGEMCVKILDFGIAKVKAETGLMVPGTLTRTGGLLGTPLYMSPEQVRRPGSVDARSDVWSLGIVLFECLSGDVPFPSGTTVGELMADVLTSELRLLQDLSPWVPSELAAIVHQALSRDLSRRFPDAGAMRDALAQVVAGSASFHERDLLGVSASDKTKISPRLVLLHDQEVLGAPATALTRADPAPRPRPIGHEPTWVSPSSDPVPPGAATTSVREQRRITKAMFGALGILAALALGMALLARSSAGNRRGVASSAASLHAAATLSAPTPSAEPNPPAARPSTERVLWLRVPPGSTVRVNGNSEPVKDGRVAVRGIVGETPMIELARRKQALRTRIAITDDGLLPDQLNFTSVAGTPAVSARPVHGAAKEGAGASAGTPKPAESVPASRPSPELIESTNEF